jgi:hypothetical protein
MRKTPKDGADSEVAISLAEALATLSHLADRVSELETVVFGQRMQPISAQQAVNGRKPKVAHAVVLARRDQLTSWIERNWPYLSGALGEAEFAGEAVLAILRTKRRDQALFMDVPFHKEPEKYQADLWEFIQGKRFRGNPRNLAGAMAGLPELRPKTSLDLCQRSPCERILDCRAWRDYLRRRFPKRWNELRNAQGESELTAILKKTSAKDTTYNYLKEHPKEALYWLRVTDPERLRNTPLETPGDAPR